MFPLTTHELMTDIILCASSEAYTTRCIQVPSQVPRLSPHLPGPHWFTAPGGVRPPTSLAPETSTLKPHRIQSHLYANLHLQRVSREESDNDASPGSSDGNLASEAPAAGPSNARPPAERVSKSKLFTLSKLITRIPRLSPGASSTPQAEQPMPGSSSGAAEGLSRASKHILRGSKTYPLRKGESISSDTSIRSDEEPLLPKDQHGRRSSSGSATLSFALSSDGSQGRL